MYKRQERAEIINYGLQNIIGEIPKIFLVFLLAAILNILDLTLIAFLSIFTYRTFSGGVHAKTHWLCIMLTLSLIHIWKGSFPKKQSNKLF